MYFLDKEGDIMSEPIADAVPMDSLQVQSPDEDLQKKAHEWRNKSAQDLVNDIKAETKNKKVQLQIDMVLARVQEVCTRIAEYIEDVPRGMKYRNDEMRNIFEQVADAVREIPYSPRHSQALACAAKVDAAKIPDLYQATRDAGYEEGYRQALQKGAKHLTSDLDIDID